MKIEETAPVTIRDVRLVLKEHWLTEIKCEHQSRSDQTVCWCGWTSAWYPSVGEALNVWIYHVCEHLAASQTSSTLSKTECNDVDNTRERQ